MFNENPKFLMRHFNRLPIDVKANCQMGLPVKLGGEALPKVVRRQFMLGGG